MLQSLAVVCTAARQSSELSFAHVAAEAGVSELVIRAFEQGRRWPRDFEAVVDAYAALTNKQAYRLWSDAASVMPDE